MGRGFQICLVFTWQLLLGMYQIIETKLVYLHLKVKVGWKRGGGRLWVGVDCSVQIVPMFILEINRQWAIIMSTKCTPAPPNGPMESMGLDGEGSHPIDALPTLGIYGPHFHHTITPPSLVGPQLLHISCHSEIVVSWGPILWVCMRELYSCAPHQLTHIPTFSFPHHCNPF